MSLAGSQAAVELAHVYAEVVASLTPDEWAQPSRCAGWTVQDLVAHTGSNFQLLAVPPDPGAPVPDVETAEQLQGLLVEQRRGWSAAQVADEFATFIDPACGVLAALQAPHVATAPMTLTNLGTYDTHLLADAFAFDLWCHLTVDLLAPQGPVQRPPPPPTDALLAPGVGWMLTGLPQMCPPVSHLLDRPLGLRLTGPGGGEWTLVPGTLLTVENGLHDSAATATSSASDFVLWGTGRTSWRDHTTLAGDEVYAARILDAVDVV